MSYSNPNVENTHIGNGTDTIFGINFYYQQGETSVIRVELWDYTSPLLPVQQSFILNVDYTIDESGYPSTNIVTAVPVSNDYKLIVYRSTIPIQTSNFVNGAFPAESVEDALDRVTMIAQELDAILDRAIVNPIGGPSFSYADLLDLEADVTQAQLDIITNANNITTNANDIAQLQVDVLSLQPESVVSIASAQTYVADNREVIIIDTVGVVQIDLPAATIGYNIKVKISEKVDTKTIVASEGIDGFGTTYTLSSEYESVSLVSDGIKWYII